MRFSKKVKNYIMSLVVTAVMTKVADVIVDKITKDDKTERKDG